jgi:hypothetical protein
VQTTLTVALCASALFVLGLGTAAVFSRTPKWLDGQIARPRLWGVGQLLIGSMAAFQAVSAVADLDWDTRFTLANIGLVCVLLGVVLMWKAKRPLPLPRPSHGQHDLPE